MKYTILMISLFISTLSYGQKQELHNIDKVYYSNTNDYASYEEFLSTLSNVIKTAENNVSTQEEKYVIEATGLFLSDNLLSSKKDKKKNVKLFKALYTKMNDYANELGRDKLSAEYLTSLAVIVPRFMAKEPLGTLIKLSKQGDKDYELALKKDNKYFFAYISFGQRYMFAPKIGGGSLSKALKYYNDAEKVAVYPYEKYQVYVWRSQVYFKEKNFEKSEEELKKAASILPAGGLHNMLKELNKKGKTIS